MDQSIRWLSNMPWLSEGDRKDVDIELELYVDSDFGNRTDRLLISGYTAMLGK